MDVNYNLFSIIQCHIQTLTVTKNRNPAASTYLLQIQTHKRMSTAEYQRFESTKHLYWGIHIQATIQWNPSRLIKTSFCLHSKELLPGSTSAWAAQCYINYGSVVWNLHQQNLKSDSEMVHIIVMRWTFRRSCSHTQTQAAKTGSCTESQHELHVVNSRVNIKLQLAKQPRAWQLAVVEGQGSYWVRHFDWNLTQPSNWTAKVQQSKHYWLTQCQGTSHLLLPICCPPSYSTWCTSHSLFYYFFFPLTERLSSP